MSTWVFSSPWPSLARRLGLRLDFLHPHPHPHTPGLIQSQWSSPLPLLLRAHYSVLTAEGDPPSLVAMRNEPYPLDQPDSSIFEDYSMEYEKPAGLLMKPIKKPKTSSDMLAQLVVERNFEDAERLLSELRTVGVVVKPDTRYLDAALDVYRREDTAQVERLEQFSTWLSLIPDASNARNLDLTKIQGLILGAAHIPDMPIIIRFALIAASKGYASHVWEDTIALVVRYCPPRISSRFLYEFREAHRRYSVRFSGPLDSGSLTNRESTGSITL